MLHTSFFHFNSSVSLCSFNVAVRSKSDLVSLLNHTSKERARLRSSCFPISCLRNRERSTFYYNSREEGRKGKFKLFSLELRCFVIINGK